LVALATTRIEANLIDDSVFATRTSVRAQLGRASGAYLGATMSEEVTTSNEAKGLYDPAFERDSCGFGLIANLDDKPSHWLVDTAITALARLTHRGAVASDGKTGDGCGLLLKFPASFFRSIAAECGISVAERFA